ncbi:MAG: hypothetical protein E4H27_03435 [Anaerolineales bacterium]|nr:MAG: hypothetical protein E4H27_03435 [Anaerolineales bacterium]
MVNEFIVYISAASDLHYERDILGRIAAEIPVDIGWRIVQSPTGDGLLDQHSIQFADLHFLLLGGDIRAPIGQEWILAKQAGRQPIPYLKQGILQTSAAIDFKRFIQVQATWKHFSTGAELRRSALFDITDRLLNFAPLYGLSVTDIREIEVWRNQLKTDSPVGDELGRGATATSSLILSPETIASKGGILLNRSGDG